MATQGTGAQPAAAHERWVLAYEHGPARRRPPVGTRLAVGRSLEIGRERELSLGVEVTSEGISRVAVVVTATEAGWDLDLRNANGATLHAWGQPPQQISGHQSIAWPRVAIRFHNGQRFDQPHTSYHWVLLEADLLVITPAGPRPSSRTTSATVTPAPPGPLSGPQEDAVRTVFEPLLVWPPRVPAEPLQLKQVASRLGISEAGVRDRLAHAHDRALRLGLHHNVGLNNPEYLYVLVSNGYLAAPTGGNHRVALPWLE
ncbi:hypothetical protein [Pseudofrankia sp. DC12]|uniref:hypothetical protein n=1 Tax=Pseudofrankia sp. DC12 TaxID=683315 RepID=UPI0005F890CA|nr:hypothetical protein [Pseudofrankia sp. DC12]